MDIGTKIKNARIEARLTQEQVADALGVSRQTMSNWENGKTYPDIVSVVKMSDLYEISLDHLLKEKEEKPVSDYVDYLEESTNTVKSQKKLSLTILIATYLGIWAVALIVFWFFVDPTGAFGYGIVFFAIVLPVATFVTSLLLGANDLLGKGKWLMPVAFGTMHMLAQYATYSVASMIANQKFKMPNMSDVERIIHGMLISFVGLGLGVLVRYIKTKIRQK